MYSGVCMFVYNIMCVSVSIIVVTGCNVRDILNTLHEQIMVQWRNTQGIE